MKIPIPVSLLKSDFAPLIYNRKEADKRGDHSEQGTTIRSSEATGGGDGTGAWGIDKKDTR